MLTEEAPARSRTAALEEALSQIGWALVLCTDLLSYTFPIEIMGAY
jgi:hypothetical protein